MQILQILQAMYSISNQKVNLKCLFYLNIALNKNGSSPTCVLKSVILQQKFVI